jgi:tRNA G18 (ribose-2'-O)-methylase SpoU
MNQSDRLVRIWDADDPRIAAYRNIRERDLAGRDGRFVAEGRVVLNVLATSRHEVDSILVLENRLEGVTALLRLFRADVPVYVVEQPVMDAIAGFHMHRGLIAMAKRNPLPDLTQLLNNLPAEALVVVLSAISNHDNMGSIFRNAAAFEANALILDRQCCDPFYRKAVRVSVGGVLKVPYASAATLDEICSALLTAGFSLAALSPSGGLPISMVPNNGKRALILGTEGTGLPQYLLKSVPSYRIPMSGNFDSLNVATASGIALYHAAAVDRA